ncbi:MAG: hypothetical protein AB7I18_03530 [Candidatus Berkiella sp.]
MQHYNNISPILDELGNKLVKQVLWGLSLIGLAAFLCAMTNMAETLLIIEVATTSCAVLVSVICLTHLYREHRALKQQERQLIHALLQQVAQQFKHLPPMDLIEETLLLVLDSQGTQEQRLQVLATFRTQPAPLAVFVNYCQQIDASRAVMVDLGLCWD